MNNFLNFVCIVLVLILAASCSYNIFTPEVTHIQLDIKAVIDPNFYKLDDGIYTDVIMTAEDKKECVEIIKAATDISKQLYHDDYVFIITDEPIKGPLELKDNYEIAGQTNNHKKMITLLRKHLQNSLLHEIGHAVDNTYCFSATQEFQALYANCEYEYYYTSNASEYFAENYARFIQGKLTDKELIEYYQNIIGEKEELCGIST